MWKISKIIFLIPLFPENKENKVEREETAVPKEQQTENFGGGKVANKSSHCNFSTL